MLVPGHGPYRPRLPLVPLLLLVAGGDDLIVVPSHGPEHPVLERRGLRRGGAESGWCRRGGAPALQGPARAFLVDRISERRVTEDNPLRVEPIERAEQVSESLPRRETLR